MAWEDALRKRKASQPINRCSICLILIGEGHIERVGYPSEYGIICGTCRMEHPIRIDTAERGWQERIKLWQGLSPIGSQQIMEP